MINRLSMQLAVSITLISLESTRVRRNFLPQFSYSTRTSTGFWLILMLREAVTSEAAHLKIDRMIVGLLVES